MYDVAVGNTEFLDLLFVSLATLALNVVIKFQCKICTFIVVLSCTKQPGFYRFNNNNKMDSGVHISYFTTIISI